MIENSNITDTYKAEIIEILGKVSAGLSESVTTVIKPKILDISSNVISQNELLQIIKVESKETSDYLKERVENFGSSVKSIKSTTENLEKSIEQRDLNVISSIENNTNLLSQFKKTSDELNERVENFGGTVKSIKSTTENLEKSIEQRDLNVISSIENNTNLLSQLKKTCTDDLFHEIQKISNSEKNKTLETKIIELQTKQQFTQKLMYAILVSLLILSSLIIFLVLK